MSPLWLTTLLSAPAASILFSRLLFSTPLWLPPKYPRVLDSRPFGIYFMLTSTFLPLATIQCLSHLLPSSVRLHLTTYRRRCYNAHTPLCSLSLTNAGSLDLSSLLPSHPILTLLTIPVLVKSLICPPDVLSFPQTPYDSCCRCPTMTSPPSPVDLSSLAALVAPSPSSQVELVAILDAATSADTHRMLLNQVTQFCFVVDPVQQTLRALSVPVPATSAASAAICLGSLGDQANFAIPISISSDAFDHLVVSKTVPGNPSGFCFFWPHLLTSRAARVPSRKPQECS